ncbi:MAG: hypothetical protein KME17_29845 [Cyanosarcina radialis HA8281-LM2]|jgi:hypothetical protein|nr:hypothetical protein [Cyanosarcina radialis HA8281-LM2]
MLAYILALAVALGSVALYLAAFFLPEIHKKNDLIWSGVGLFYALVLWVCAGRIGGGLLLGQIAGVALLGWFAWETLTLRRELLPADQQTKIPSKEQFQEQLSKLPLPAPIQQAVGKLTKGEGKAAIADSKGAVQEQISKIDLSGITDKLKELYNQAKDRVQELIGKAQQPKVQPPVAKSPPPPAPKPPAPPATPAPPPVVEEEEEEFIEEDEEEEPQAVAAPVVTPEPTPAPSAEEPQAEAPPVATPEPTPAPPAEEPQAEAPPVVTPEPTPAPPAEEPQAEAPPVVTPEPLPTTTKESEIAEEDSLQPPNAQQVEEVIAEAEKNAETPVEPEQVHPEPEVQQHPVDD